MLQEVLLRKLKICFYRFDYFFLTSINNRNRLFKMWKFFTCLSVILTISLITDTHETLLKCKEPVRRFHASKIKRAKARINYYNTSIATFKIIISGDIEQKPGPSLPKPKYPKCGKTARCNLKHLICQLCLDVAHANCVTLKHRLRNSRDAERWTCYDCLFHVLPFKNYDDTIDETLAVNVSPKNINTHHKESLKHHHRHISIAHLNTQSLVSTFDIFHLMLENHKFDIVALNETWLKDNKHQYKYVQIPGYNTVLRNRENKKGGGVSFYVKTT